MLQFKGHFTRGYIAGLSSFVFGVLCHWFANSLALSTSNSFFRPVGNDFPTEIDLTALNEKAQTTSAMNWVALTFATLGFLFILITFWQWSKQVPPREEVEGNI